MERLFRYVLKQCLDEYVNGVDSQILFSSSSVTVQDLELRQDKMKDLFKGIAEPLEFGSGTIGSLQVRMPIIGELEIEASSVVFKLGFSPSEFIRQSLLPAAVKSVDVLDPEPRQKPLMPLSQNSAASISARPRELLVPLGKDPRPRLLGSGPLPHVHPDSDSDLIDHEIPALERLMRAIDDDIAFLTKGNGSHLDASMACANRVHLVTGLVFGDYDACFDDETPLVGDDFQDGPVFEPLPCPLCSETSACDDQDCDVATEPAQILQPRTSSRAKQHGRGINAIAKSESSPVNDDSNLASQYLECKVSVGEFS